MEPSAGWSRLVCSWQWRVKEITLGLCQQPWPCSHRNIMRKDMLGLQGRKKKKKEKRGLSLEHSSQTATGGKQLFACCFTSRGQWVRRLQSTELNGAAAESGHVTSGLRSPANAMKTQINNNSGSKNAAFSISSPPERRATLHWSAPEK